MLRSLSSRQPEIQLSSPRGELPKSVLDSPSQASTRRPKNLSVAAADWIRGGHLTLVDQLDSPGGIFSPALFGLLLLQWTAGCDGAQRSYLDSVI